MKEARVNPKIVGLTLGVFWGVLLFFWTLISVFTGYSREILTLLTSVYPGYTVTYAGSIVGAIYGFVDGFIVGFVLAWIYSKFSVSDRIRKTLRAA